MLRNIFTVGGLTALSRVLGLGREMLQSRLIGAGFEQSAFALAFALPNMARKIFGEGALTSAFVPVFKEAVERGETEKAKRLVRAVLTLVLLILGSVAALVAVGLTVALHADALSPRLALTLRLVRILLPYMMFICGAAFGMGVLNALGKFAAGAFMPALLNVFWIAGLGVVCFLPGLSVAMRVTWVAWAILLGGAAQMAFLFLCMARRDFAPRLSLSALFDPASRLVWKNTFIGALGAGATQVNYMLDQVLAQCAAPWAAGVIGYADRLMDLPLGVIGVAFGTVLLPTFAGYFARDDAEGARAAMSQSIVNLMTVMMPATVGLCLVAPELTSVIYQGRAFDGLATLRVSRALAVYALGLCFFGLQKSLVPWFYAQKDVRTPLRVSLVTVGLNAALNIAAVVALPQEWRHVGLAASTVLCAIVGCALLVRLAVRRNGSLGFARVLPTLAHLLVATLAMGVAVWFVRSLLRGGALGDRPLPCVALAVEMAAGAAVYALVAFPVLRLHRRAKPHLPSPCHPNVSKEKS